MSLGAGRDSSASESGSTPPGAHARFARSSLQRVDVAHLLVAAAVTLSAWLTLPLDRNTALVSVAVMVVTGVLVREPLLLAASAILFTGANAGEQLRALAVEPPASVSGIALLVGDPERSDFGWQVLLEFAGRRYAAAVDGDVGRPLSTLATGDHVVVEGRPRPLRNAPVGWVRSNHLVARLAVRSLERGPPAAPWYRLANGVRNVLAAGSRSFDQERSPLYLGMVIGDDRDLSALREFRFRSAGLTHLSAVSGQNVGFLLLLFSPVLARFERRARWAATCFVLVFFVLVTRADPSVLRAAVMASVAAAALSSGRSLSTSRALAVAVVVLLIVDPLMVHSIGFSLSVTATLALVFAAPLVAMHLPGPSWLRVPLSATVCAQLATAPLLASIGSTSSPMAVPANLLAVPVAGAVMVLGMTVGTVAGLVAEPIAAVLQLPCRAAVGWVDMVAAVASGVPCRPIGIARLAAVVTLVALAVVARSRSVGACAAERPWGLSALRVCRRLVLVAAVVVVVISCWPSRPGAGVFSPAKGVDVVVGGCGAVVVKLSRGARGVATLTALSSMGVRRVDVLVVGGGAGRVGASVAEQWPVRRRLDEGRVSGPESFSVGGVDVDVSEDAVQIGLSEGPCSLGP